MEVRVALVGLGSVGRNLLRVIKDKNIELMATYGLSLKFVLLADSSGYAFEDTVIDM